MSAPFEANSINIIKMKGAEAIFPSSSFSFSTLAACRATHQPAAAASLRGAAPMAKSKCYFLQMARLFLCLGAPEVCISLTSPAKSALFVCLALMFPECFPVRFQTSSRAVVSSSCCAGDDSVCSFSPRVSRSLSGLLLQFNYMPVTEDHLIVQLLAKHSVLPSCFDFKK